MWMVTPMLARKPTEGSWALPSDARPLTEMVCWSRMQAEAGEELRSIVRRKELERAAGNGLFCWGVGNAPSRSIPVLSRAGSRVDVVFSIMKSRAKAEDASPQGLTIWRAYLDYMGCERPLPAASLVTSRATAGGRAKRAHYALICRSEVPMELGDFGPFDPSAYRNASELAGEVGASQVTALVRRVSDEGGDTGYRVNLRAELAREYWVRLTDPIEVTADKRDIMDGAFARLEMLTPGAWLDIVHSLREGSVAAVERQSSLF
jgi:hypothetical protein